MFRGYYIAPQPIGLWKSDLPWPKRAAANSNPIPDFIARPEDHQILLPWTPADLKRLELPGDLLVNDGNKHAANLNTNAAGTAVPKRLILVKRRNPPAGEARDQKVSGDE